MDVHELGLDMVIWLQKNLNSFQSCFLWFSSFGDPRNTFLLIFPICYGLNRNTGITCLWIASLTEWINAILKWFFQDDRPYWYIKSKSELSHLSLEQFPITCETGPGFPSGHVMSITAVGLHLVLALNAYIGNNKRLARWMEIVSRLTLISIFLAVVFLVAVSRVYIATHFPHQVAVAFIVGLSVTYFINKFSSSFNLSKANFCIASSVVLLIGAYLFHEGLVALNYDPSNTVSLAQKWCFKAEWVHLDTTPFYAITRDAGVIFGLGLASLAIAFLRTDSTLFQENRSLVSVGLQISLNLLFCFWLESCQIPQKSQLLFYTLAFCKFAVIPLVVVCGTPLIVLNICKYL